MGANPKPLLSPLTFSPVWGDLLFLTVSHINDDKRMWALQLPGMSWVSFGKLWTLSCSWTPHLATLEKSCSGRPMWSSWQAKHRRAFCSSHWVSAAASLHGFSIGDEKAFGHTSLWGTRQGSVRWLGYGEEEPTALLKVVSAPIGLRVPETTAETWLGRRTSWGSLPLQWKHMLRKCSWRNLRHWRSKYAVKTSRMVSTPNTWFILPAYTTTQIEGRFLQWEWERLVRYIYGIQ